MNNTYSKEKLTELLFLFSVLNFINVKCELNKKE